MPVFVTLMYFQAMVLRSQIQAYSDYFTWGNPGPGENRGLHFWEKPNEASS